MIFSLGPRQKSPRKYTVSSSLTTEFQLSISTNLGTTINIAFTLYMLDFFLMPFAYGEIDIEKLPFHACTAMCVLCFLSYHNRFLEKYRMSFVLLGFISNLVYLIYPAGVMWHAVHPLSYRVIQTLLFHSIMTLSCLLTLIYESDKINIKKCHRDLAVTAVIKLAVCLTAQTRKGRGDDAIPF